MKSSFIKNLQRGFGLSLFILLLSSIASYLSIYKLKDRADWVNHTNIVLQQTDRISAFLSEAESEQRGYLLTGYTSFLSPYNFAKENVSKSVDRLAKLTSDNPRQRVNCRILILLVQKRIEKLDDHIGIFKAGKKEEPADFIEGQSAMTKTRQLLNNIRAEEERLLVIRSEGFSVYSWLTPLVLIITSLAAVIITLVFYRKIRQDYELRLSLQQTLEKNEIETVQRIAIIEEVASQVSSGNYKVRVHDKEGDNLGKLSIALNAMAASLNESFEDYAKREWLKNGSAELNEKMIGEKDTYTLSKNIITSLVGYSNSQAGAIYLYENESLVLKAGVAINKEKNKRFAMGEGLIGQCAESKKMMVLNNLPQENIIVSYAAGNIKPDNLIVFPVFWEGELKAVVETVSLTPYPDKIAEWYNAICSNIGLSVESARQHTRLQQLLNETQAQAEELQVQQHELEHLNADLETQAQKLQVSEEELKVQQEELMQANQELEERSSILEEKNQMIVERNLEIQKKSNDLEISTKYKSEFLANMSHELRTPLNSILLLSRLLSENDDNNLTQEQIEFANVILSSGNGLLTLIDEILDLSKIEAGKMKVEFRNVNLAETKSNLNALFTPIAKEKNLSFSISIKDEVPAVIHTDSVRLEQILKNLLSNAIKFTSLGSVTLSINLAAGNNVQFAVSDTGIGIAADKQAMVFEAFQQADGSTRRKYGGTGLGLSISRQLAKLLGGEIVLESEPGKGSTFSLIIPIDASTQTSEPINETPLWQEVKAEKPAPAYKYETLPAKNDQEIFDDRDNIKPGDKTILIIEDDIHFAQTLLATAHKNNYKALHASRGDYGLQLAAKYLPNAILLDIKLPVKDGWQVMDELKANAATKYIPVHMMSSMHAKEESLKRGAINFIDKPVAFEKLPDVFNAIESALQRGSKKILIVEENEKHAQALCYFLESYNINVKGTHDINEAIKVLQDDSTYCVVLEMKVFADNGYEALENVKNISGLEHLPIVIFTGKSLSKAEEIRIKQVADSIVIKTANSYRRILDEIDMFLQIVEESDPAKSKKITRRQSALEQVLENKTVLIADDDVRNIYSLTKALESHKMNVISATDGKDALEQLTKNPAVNIVLMDMMMPEMDGYEATQAIRKMPQYRNLPVLAVTAKAMYGDREKCIQAGASDYISKPIDIDQLVSLLRVWLYHQ